MPDNPSHVPAHGWAPDPFIVEFHARAERDERADAATEAAWTQAHDDPERAVAGTLPGPTPSSSPSAPARPPLTAPADQRLQHLAAELRDCLPLLEPHLQVKAMFLALGLDKLAQRGNR